VLILIERFGWLREMDGWLSERDGRLESGMGG
jgi:hypothetical protein